jgi:hypothetical protein
VDINIEIPTALKAEYVIFNEDWDDDWQVIGEGHAVIVSFGEYEIARLEPAIDDTYVNGQYVELSPCGYIDREEDRKLVAEYTLAQALKKVFDVDRDRL